MTEPEVEFFDPKLKSALERRDAEIIKVRSAFHGVLCIQDASINHVIKAEEVELAVVNTTLQFADCRVRDCSDNSYKSQVI